MLWKTGVILLGGCSRVAIARDGREGPRAPTASRPPPFLGLPPCASAPVTALWTLTFARTASGTWSTPRFPSRLAMVSLIHLYGKTQKQKWNDCLWEVANDKEQGKRIHQKPYSLAMVSLIHLYEKME